MERLLAAAAGLLFLLLLETVVLDSKNVLFPFFYAWFGFAITVAFIAAGRALGSFLRRPQSHYTTEEKNG